VYNPGEYSVLHQRWEAGSRLRKPLTILDSLWYNHDEEREKRRDELVQPVGQHIAGDKGQKS
jgi:hypothetical protein